MGAAGILGNGDDLSFPVRLEVIGPIGTDRRKCEVRLRPQLAARPLQTETERVPVLPIDQQQVVQSITINIDDLDRFDTPGERDFFGLGQRVVLSLGKKINVILRQQHQIGAAIAIQIAGTQSVWGKLAIFQRPAFRSAPAVGSLVVLNHQFLRFPVISDVRTAIAVQVGQDQ